MKMKAKKNEVISEERVCKKCGDPLRSTSKYKYCDNCRREKAKGSAGKNNEQRYSRAGYRRT